MINPPTPPPSNWFTRACSKLLPAVKAFWSFIFALFVANFNFFLTWSSQNPIPALFLFVVALSVTLVIWIGAQSKPTTTTPPPLPTNPPKWAKWAKWGLLVGGGVAMALWVFLVPVSSTTLFYTLIPQELIALGVLSFSIIQIWKMRHQPGPGGASGLPPTNPPNKP